MGPIRALAVLPVLLCTVALILSFLCLFAGSKRNFMEDYSIITLNTSQIGQNLPIFDQINDSISNNLRRDVEDVPSPTTTVVAGITPAAELTAAELKERGDIQSWWSEGTAGVASLYTKATGAISVPTQAVAAVDWLKTEGHQLTEELVQEAENITAKFEHYIEQGLGDFAEVLGLHDFYSAHILNFCEGFYTPASIPNATVSQGSISKNVTHCSNKTAMYHFDPATSISQELNQSTGGFINLSTVQWPSDIENALNALKVAQQVVFVLYCLAIGFIFLALIGAIMGVFFNGWMSAAINVVTDLLAFLTITVASALITFIAQHATHFINKYGDQIGVSANRGNKFLALTWATVGCVGVAGLVWTYLMFTAVRGGMKRKREMQEKHHG